MNFKHPDRLYKSDRLNYIVNRMRLRQDITPAMLAAELHVSERTIYRDLRNLERDNALKKRYSRREGRYMLETELLLPPVTFTPSEAVALFTAASNPALSHDNFYAEDLRSGLSKLAQSLSPDRAEPDDEEPAFLHGYAVVTEPINVTADSIQRPTTELIRRAMFSNRKLRFRYWSHGSGQAEDQVVAPYDLRYIDNDWYLLGQSEQNAIRTFKVGRMRSVEILPERFRFPRRFVADSHFARAFESSSESDPELRAKIWFSAAVSRLILDNRGQQFVSVEPLRDGAILCTLAVNSFKEILWWILAYGADAMVIEPEAFREECRKTVLAMARLYEE